VGELASAVALRDGEATIIAELQAGSESAFAWLVAQYHQPIYSLVYRILDDPGDAPDVTQEVFLKVFKGIHRFNGESTLKTWVYRIALHEAANRRRWWFRHKIKETSIESGSEHGQEEMVPCSEVREAMVDESASPLDCLMHEEVRSSVEQVLKELPEPYRTTVILRDIEELSYEQISEVMGTTLGTVKSRLVRGRDQLKQRLRRVAVEMGFSESNGAQAEHAGRSERRNAVPESRKVEVEQ
jgi:RNA polymerase sigma-70 factor (ECF subfamily)